MVAVWFGFVIFLQLGVLRAQITGGSQKVITRVCEHFAKTHVQTLFTIGSSGVTEKWSTWFPLTGTPTSFSLKVNGIEKATLNSGDVRFGQHFTMATIEASLIANPFAAVTVDFSYEEVLVRQLGFYELCYGYDETKVKSNQVGVDVYSSNAILALASSLKDRSGTKVDISANTIISKKSHNGHVYFDAPKRGLVTSGIMCVRYSVNLTNDYSAIVGYDGFNTFATVFFHPRLSQQYLGKNVIFVVDISGSMGRNSRMAKTRDAVEYAVGTLRGTDQFMIILFDDKLDFWPPNEVLVWGNAANKALALAYCRLMLKPRASTDINQALEHAIKRLQASAIRGKNIIFFISDGHPNRGITDTAAIVANIKTLAYPPSGYIYDPNSCPKPIVTIFSLGISNFANLDLITRVSTATLGAAKLIDDKGPVSLQIQEFFNQIANALLYSLAIKPSAGFNTTSFPTPCALQYYFGSQLALGLRFNNGENQPGSVVIQGTGKGNVTKTYTIKVDPTQYYAIKNIDRSMCPQDFYLGARMAAILQITHLARSCNLTTNAAACQKKVQSLKLVLQRLANYTAPAPPTPATTARGTTPRGTFPTAKPPAFTTPNSSGSPGTDVATFLALIVSLGVASNTVM